MGYRLFDTAYMYQNEVQVGQAIRDKIAEGVIKRQEIFLVTKVCIYINFLIKFVAVC